MINTDICHILQVAVATHPYISVKFKHDVLLPKWVSYNTVPLEAWSISHVHRCHVFAEHFHHFVDNNDKRLFASLKYIT